MRKLVHIIFGLAIVVFAGNSFAQQEKPAEPAAPKAEQPAGLDLDALLELVRRGKINETEEYRLREAAFLRKKSEQQRLLKEGRNTQRAEERRSDRLENTFKVNVGSIEKLQVELSKELGALKELFGVLQLVSGDARAIFKDSIISAQFPGREKFLADLVAKTSSSSKLPTIEEIGRLWFEVQREMTEQGRVVKFVSNIQYPNGETQDVEIVRIGTFNLIADGKYLERDTGSGRLLELVRQPPSRFLDTAEALQTATSGFEAFGLDPSRGSILALLIQAPSMMERVDQGGTIGYIILYGLGTIAVIFLLERFIYLFNVRGKVNAQIRSDVVNEGNPLGRVLSVYDRNRSVDVETLELKLDEAIMKETPALERFLPLIKIIAAIAPLMGLLGTVTGMINTFQSMTLFGTGDPKLMAGGISQALVTTVLGIVVALPTLFMHSIVQGWSRRIIHTLEEQSAGIIAVHAEQNNKRSA